MTEKEKAIAYDLDRLGIKLRTAEVAELVELRAEVARLQAGTDAFLQKHREGVDLLCRTVAERQREACAEWVRKEGFLRASEKARNTPLVTEEKP